jgi:hypothetical protein
MEKECLEKYCELYRELVGPFEDGQQRGYCSYDATGSVLRNNSNCVFPNSYSRGQAEQNRDKKIIPNK